MSPAFSSVRQAGAFAAIVLAILLSPLLAGKYLLPPRESIYTSAPWRIGPFPYIDHLMFHEKGDIDILFIGSSHMYFGLNTPYVQEKLSENLGRPSVVRSMCWSWGGFDAAYFLTRDLLRNRKVHMLVFYDEEPENMPHSQAYRWFRWADDSRDLQGLPLRMKLALYAEAIRGVPLAVLDRFRSNLPDRPFLGQEIEMPRKPNIVKNPADRLGALSVLMGFDDSHPFEKYQPRTGATPSDVSVYSEATAGTFDFSAKKPLHPFEAYFAQKLARLASENGVRLVWIHIPTIDEVRNPKITAEAFWPKLMDTDVAMLGMPPEKMFAGLSDKEVLRLFFNPAHFNQNGQEYFTPLITPALIDLYDIKSHH